MELTQSVTEVICARSSRRKYRRATIDTKSREILEKWLAAISGGPFRTPLRLKLIAATENDRAALKGLGTYGFIRGAPGFIIGAAQRGERDMEDFGHVMEQAILLATDLGLGTCWLGGTFTRSSFAEKITVKPNETMPAVVAIGYATDKHGALAQLVRWGAKAKQRRDSDSPNSR